MPDAALKNALSAITRQYRYILIDSPGGLEHLNRKIASDVDMIFDVMGPSSKSFAHVQRAHRVIDEVGIRYNHIYVVGGYAFPAELETKAAAETGIPYLGKIAADSRVADQVLAGKSLLDLPTDLPAYRSITAMFDTLPGVP
jgi:CO dehydrogenase maturation factor